MNTPSHFTPKTAGAGLSGSLGILLVWLLSLAHVTVDPRCAAALVAVLSGFAAWLAPTDPG